ncbi:hypothetical protein [Mesorhizobium sp. M1B.F.Ca.ET.045.04.1.1]|uniref:hypothetical protein n=1 Tax=Mesorhizobium sp. M1B.F.Ca.ET.045.04.1.1 TaxID=2493673 RepID=UPI000F74CA53|nr:hypothetical protein [Mesorhizobium sp. M1B.F.Ca.ET.045.04.1.1]AZO32417.1 hypothetical protein EJ071_37125 [Mesorhizobium sp. M1B.F.Ca.ET.045.04.1.1]
MRKPDSVSVAPKLGFLYRIGRCPKCMRQSLLFAVASLSLWAASLAADSIYGGVFYGLTVAHYLLTALSIGAILLWLLHLCVYAFRTAFGAGSATSRSVSGLAANRTSSRLPAAARRHALRTLAKAFVGAAVATVLPSMALAFNECPGQLTCGFSSCAPSSGTYCCPKGYPILSLCNCRCYASVQGLNCNQTGSCFDENF